MTIIREKNCGTKVFREMVNEISTLMAYEVSRDMPLKDIEIETPIAKSTQKTLAGKKVAIVPILRAGLGMVDGFLNMIPAAKVGHVGMYRDEKTLKPVEYFVKLPSDISQRQLFVVDPMLATGGSAIMAMDMLKKRGASNIKFMCLVAAPEGVKALRDAHPDIDVYTAALDDHLNEDGYIVPGLGDAGDRLFGTK
ncbi:uracil phosphoribosyltransferase [Lactiplantibacillus plantarum 2165]|nr:uracil phosphoribosyltransferase [Lactiplantibacillus plantarum 2165]